MINKLSLIMLLARVAYHGPKAIALVLLLSSQLRWTRRRDVTASGGAMSVSSSFHSGIQARTAVCRMAFVKARDRNTDRGPLLHVPAWRLA